MEGHKSNAVDHSTLSSEKQKELKYLKRRIAEEARKTDTIDKEICKYSIAEVFERLAKRGAGLSLTPLGRMTNMNDTNEDQQGGTPRATPSPEVQGPPEASPSPTVPPPSAMSEICLQSGGADQIVNFNPQSTVGLMGGGSSG